MRILVPVNGSAPANRAVAYAAALARDKADASLILINVQSSETLDVSDFTAVISVTPIERQRPRDRERRCAGLSRSAGKRRSRLKHTPSWARLPRP
jgi:nucleotide-binding universal stress UspA family protein